MSTDEIEVVFESQSVVTEPQSIVTEPQSIVTEPQSIATEPQSIVTEPQSIVIEPRSVVAEPQSTTTPCKKRKAEEMEAKVVEKPKVPDPEPDDDVGDDAISCNICFEPWSNTGVHRISSLKCGHFFGLACIEKWLNSTGGNDCPTCNEKATKRDIRHHYVAKLKAIDTGDRDRALEQVETLKKELRTKELEHATLKVTNHLQKQEIEKLKALITSMQNGSTASLQITTRDLSLNSQSSNSGSQRLTYIKRLEIFKPDPSNNDHNKYCRVMCYNDNYGMLVVSQPSSFNQLAPGYGIRRVHMLDKKLDSYVSLHREPIRDLAFNPFNQDQLLSVSQDKTIRLTNVSSKAEIQRYQCESQVWCCCWNAENQSMFYVGTMKGQVFIYDMRDPSPNAKLELEFPTPQRLGIIAVCHVPKSNDNNTFPCAGLFVMTLNSLWFFEEVLSGDGNIAHRCHKIPIEGNFWSLCFNYETRMLLVNFKPNPHARHAVLQIERINVTRDVTQGPDYHLSQNIVFDNKKGGTYKGRSFLKSVLCQKPGGDDGQLIVMHGRGSGSSDHKLLVQEVGSERVMQEVQISKPIIDICALKLNSDHIVCVLTENELHLYQWT